MASAANPEKSPHPRMSLDDARKRGFDVSVMPTCGVREDGKVKGCSFAVQCATRMFARPGFGGFGPPSTAPGTSGTGPAPVQGYHLDSVTQTEHEFQMQCHAFMQNLWDEFRQQDDTGDKVLIYPPGTPITIQRYVTEVDAMGNKKAVLKTMTQEPFAKDDPEIDARAEFRRRIAENQQKIRADMRLSQSVERLDGGAEREDSPQAGAVAEPVLKGPKK